MQRAGDIVNALTVDVEDYFQVSAFERYIGRSEWDSRECRIERNTQRVLDMFASHGCHATFFVLGWVAERYPALVRRIVGDGHELASHGYEHTRVVRQTREEFRADVTRTRGVLEDVAGVRVKGYRAASYSIGRDNLWALDILQETGHEYSSSIYPVRHDLYGMPEAERFAHHVGGRGILEVPVSTVELFGHKFPCGGGGYFRLFPYRISRWAIGRVNHVERQPCNFYFHPWEIDPGQPRVPGIDAKTRFRHYLNLQRMEARLNRLLDDFRWGRMDEVYLSAIPEASAGYIHDAVAPGRP